MFAWNIIQKTQNIYNFGCPLAGKQFLELVTRPHTCGSLSGVLLASIFRNEYHRCRHVLLQVQHCVLWKRLHFQITPPFICNYVCRPKTRSKDWTTLALLHRPECCVHQEKYETRASEAEKKQKYGHFKEGRTTAGHRLDATIMLTSLTQKPVKGTYSDVLVEPPQKNTRKWKRAWLLSNFLLIETLPAWVLHFMLCILLCQEMDRYRTTAGLKLRPDD